MSSSPEWASWPAWPTRLERRGMSVAEYLELPDAMHAEYVDGEAIVSPPGSAAHHTAQRRVANALEAALSDSVHVRTEAGWRHGGRYRVPDVAVFAQIDPTAVFDSSTPILVVEVLSPSTASEDTVRKAGEYQRAGVLHYWIVDPTNRTLVAFANNGHGWDRLLDLDDEHPTGMVTVGEWGQVDLALTDLLRP